MYRIVQKQTFSPTTFLWEVEAPDVARAAQPGHFVMLRLREGAERVPLTIADFDRARGTVTLVVQAVGKTTQEMAGYQRGDTFEDFAGPLGVPQHVALVGNVVLVGGGLGVAPIFPQLRAFKDAGNRTTSILGFRSKELCFWEDRFREHSDEVLICTEDGSHGRQGRVTDLLAEALHTRPADLVVAVGPLPMMQACVQATRPFKVKTMVSLNAIMVDGTGMCGSCRVTVGGQVKFACVEGPDFDGHQVDFDELLARQKRFHSQEKQAAEQYAHVCNLEKQLFDQGKRNYKKLKDLQPQQTPMPERDAVERSRSFKEVNLGYSLKDALNEAERCLQCAKPACVSGCPVHVDIPRFIRHLLVRDLDGALSTIHQASLFPSICGRVCPQETQCEAQCVIGKKVQPVAIGRLERYVGDAAKGRVSLPAATQPGRVAVIGSGPAGLAAAADLAQLGFQVVVFEALHVIGGVLRYGIPAFRLPRDILDRELSRLRDLGVQFELNKIIGKTFTVQQLLEEKGFDAAFIGVGAGAPAFLGIPGEFAGQVYSANEFLTRINLMGGDLFPLVDTPINPGRSTIVIGAGNTAMDCLRVARRVGSKTVRCVYRRSQAEAPARAEELRHAREEGIEFFFLHAPIEVLTDPEGNVRALKLEEMELGERDARGRRKPMPTGRFKELACDTVIYALGTRANPILTRSTAGLGLNERENIIIDERTGATNLRGVFAGGDIVSGGATVILAMGAGRRAARGIATWLSQGQREWPVTAEDVENFAGPVEPIATLTVEHCPKCRRPLEDGEASVCCADAILSWRCRSCAQVSEGFAFPYGRCPTCGGDLEPMEPQAMDDAQVEMVRHALEIELGGLAFYAAASAEATEPLLKDLFQRFAEMERGHMDTLLRRYHLTMVPPSNASFRFEHAAIYGGVHDRPADPVNLFRIAIGFEQRAAAWFAERAAEAPERSPEARLTLELAAEERSHVAMLQTELERFQEGRRGLL